MHKLDDSKIYNFNKSNFHSFYDYYYSSTSSAEIIESKIAIIRFFTGKTKKQPGH